MVYPKNFEQKIGFDEIRTLLLAHCLSPLGKELVGEMTFCTKADDINEWMEQIREMRHIEEGSEEFPMNYFFDVRESVARIRLEGTHMDETELFDLRRSLETIHKIVVFLTPRTTNSSNPSLTYTANTLDNSPLTTNAPYPALYRLSNGVATFPDLVRRIDQILDKFGRIKDNASPELAQIRRELARTEGSISRILGSILKYAQTEGLVEKDAAPTLRDGRLVIPVAPSLKRRISGIVHDESTSGKTVFIEPTEVVEANNRIRELENDERREIIRILTEFSKLVRPYVTEILDSYRFLAQIDFIQAKARLARYFNAYEPTVKDEPHLDWIRAYHPLLRRRIESRKEEQKKKSEEQREIVPLDITLTSEQRLLIISGPNAGGKSVCLKTTGLLQYMLQCGLSIPVGERSTTGIFHKLMIDIGDEQSIENDLSTYSSHLLNMKQMMKQADGKTLLLIDEFGTGTEPTIGGAIAESVLKQFWKKKAWGVITTHYQNLKHFADSHDGIANGAMLYDRHEMRPLFQLAIGRPGSSFAIEIARKTGIPEEVIRDASEIVGNDYIQSDKYLQDIVRDKRYWENKRQTIHKREKDIERTITRYEDNLTEIERQRKEIIRKAKEQAEELFRESNKRIENAIREIRESQAEKEETRRIREELKEFEQEVATVDNGIMTDDEFAKKLKQLEQRKERKEKRKKEKVERQQQAADALKTALQKQKEGLALKPGDTVRIKGQTTVGTLESIDGKMATAIFGGMRTKMRLERLEHADRPKEQVVKISSVSRMTRETIDDRRRDFQQDIDLRGMRAEEALNQVQYFIDDAILVGVSQVRILHGKGNGILRQLIRQYLNTIPNVTSVRDEHVQFGGAGITVVELG